MIVQCPVPHQNENWANTSKSPEKQQINFSRIPLFHTKTRVSLKYSATDCPWKPFLDYNSAQTPSKSISLAILVTLRPFAMHYRKVTAKNV